MINLRIILRVVGFLLLIEGISFLASAGVSLIYGENDLPAFLISSAIVLSIGLPVIFFTRKAAKKMGTREGFTIVSLTWIVFSLFGSLPYIISGSIPSFTDAFFETMSGFTTTGASVLGNIESLPHGILFWRSLTHWLGGMGIIVLSLAILPIFGIGGMQLYAAEVPGPVSDKLSPKIKHTAKLLWGIYLLFTVAEIFLLWIGGMSFFDSVCHSFATMATGGFSTKQDSIAHWNSPYIHYVIIVFMFLAGTNFTLSYCALTGKFSRVFKDEEFRYYFIFVLVFAIIITAGLLVTKEIGIELAFRESLFQVVSIITTTGFVTANYLLWHPFLILLIFLMFFFGGSAGSTGGGIKIMRIVILLKNSYYELKRLIHPHAVIPVRFNSQSVEAKTVTNILAFFLIYLLLFILGTILFSIFEPDMDSSMGAVASCLGNIGPGLGKVGPVEHYGHVVPAGKWLLSFLMLLGRLELFTILVLFAPAFWRK